MSKYADLRWRIVDLEKALETEKTINKRYKQDLEVYVWRIHEQDKEIERLSELVAKLGEKEKE